MNLEQKIYEERRNFLENLSYLRHKYGYTQKQMANLLGISISSWRMMERGILPPRLSAKVILCAADMFGTPATKLFSEKIRGCCKN